MTSVSLGSAHEHNILFEDVIGSSDLSGNVFLNPFLSGLHFYHLSVSSAEQGGGYECLQEKTDIQDACAMTTDAVLCPTPGNSSNSSKDSGTSP